MIGKLTGEGDAAAADVQKKPLTKADGGDLLVVPVERPNGLRLINARP